MRASRRQFQKDDGTKCGLLFSATLHTNIAKSEKNQQEAKKAVYELAGWIQHPTLSAGDSSMNLNGCSLLHNASMIKFNLCNRHSKKWRMDKNKQL